MTNFRTAASSAARRGASLDSATKLLGDALHLALAQRDLHGARGGEFALLGSVARDHGSTDTEGLEDAAGGGAAQVDGEVGGAQPFPAELFGDEACELDGVVEVAAADLGVGVEEVAGDFAGEDEADAGALAAGEDGRVEEEERPQ